MRLVCRSFSRLQRASDTTLSPPKSCSLKPVAGVCWLTRRTTQTTYAMRSRRRGPQRSFHPRQAVPRDFPYDKELYKARSEIECTFNLLKQARRFATRYEKTLRNYAAVVALGCALVWLRI